MPATILMYQLYSKEQAYEALPDIPQATIDTWFASDVTIGKGKRTRRYPIGGLVAMLPGNEIQKLAMQYRGKTQFFGEAE